MMSRSTTGHDMVVVGASTFGGDSLRSMPGAGEPEETPMRGTRAEGATLRVLVVEDSMLMAEVLSDALQDAGYQVVGPVPDLESGRTLALERDLDGALLDINLFGQFCFPIAEVLERRGIPFLFLTGYDSPQMIPPSFRAVRRLSKPVDPSALLAAMAATFRPVQSAGSR